MNHTQKLADEALQVYRATGLSPRELKERFDLFYTAMQHTSGIMHYEGLSGRAQHIDDILRRNKL